MHILLNLETEKINSGEVLKNFKSFAQDLPADMRGLCLSNSLEIREIHNEFGNIKNLLAYGNEEEDDEDDEKKNPKDKDSFHFVAFLNRNSLIYELDGLKDAPILHGKVENECEWGKKVLEIIKTRTSQNKEQNSDLDSEIRFNLMVLVPDRREVLKDEIDGLKQKQIYNTSDTRDTLDTGDTSDTSRADKDEDISVLKLLIKTQNDLDEEESKWSRYRKEWADRNKNAENARDIQPKLSAQVKDLLKSMALKGLIPK